MKRKYLILGATGSIGFAFTNELLRNGIEAEILVRDRRKAEDLFHKNPLLTIYEGEVTDTGLLKSLSENKDVIFHGINYPYQLWGKYMIPITSNIIQVISKISNQLI